MLVANRCAVLRPQGKCRAGSVPRSARATLALIVLALYATVMSGQSRLGSISGVVLDSSRAGIDNVHVVVRNTATGVSRETRTAAGGHYRVTALDYGVYSVRLEAQGFQPAVRQGVVLNVDSEPSLSHLLEVATQHSSATVTDQSTVVETSLSGSSNVVLERTIREQPLNGRDYLQLALLQPGVIQSTAKTRNNNGGYGVQLSIGGSRPTQNNFRLDGLSQSDYTGSSIGSVNGVNLGVDTLREFAVLTNGFSAEYGRAAGGVVNAVTRSGENTFHGTLSYFHRDGNVDARNYFDPADKPAFRRQQFGGTAGGPISRNKTFVFGGYEGLRQTRGDTATSTTLSNNAKAGILGSGAVEVDPAIASIVRFFPSPNGSVTGDSGLFIYTNDTVASEDFATARLDHYFSDSLTLFARYAIDDADRSGLTEFAAGRTKAATRRQSFVIEESRAFSSTLVNSLRFGVTRVFSLNNLTATVQPELDDPKYSLVATGAPVGILDVGGLSVFPGGSGAEDYDRQAYTSFQVYEDLSYVRGRHWLKLGFTLDRTRLNADSRSGGSGEMRFPTIADFLQNRSDRFRALLPGSDTIRGLRQWIGAWYIRDRWQISRTFSLELGVRHEWISVPTEVNGKIANLDTLLSPAIRVGDPLFENPSLLNFAPRAGISWDLRGNGRTVLRAGYGIYHDQILVHFLLNSGFRNPPVFLLGAVNGMKTGRFPNHGYEEMTSNPVIDMRAERLPRKPGQPSVQRWSFTIDQSVGFGSLQLAYAGSHGVHLSGLVEDANLAPSVTLPDGRTYFPAGASKVNPAFSLIRDRIFEGQSFYNSLQAAWELRSVQRLQLRASYLLSKNIDDDSATFSQSEAANSIGIPVTGNSRFNRGLSNNDQRQNFVAALTAELGSPPARWLQPAFGGWRISSITTLRSGNPFTVTLGYDGARTLTNRNDWRGGQRPDLTPGFTGPVVTGDPDAWFNVRAFQRPEPGFLGNLGRNTFSGPGGASVDAVLAKRIAIGHEGRYSVDLRFEAFNLLNHANFNLPASERMQVFTRTSVREDAGRITTAAAARELQIGIKVQF